MGSLKPSQSRAMNRYWDRNRERLFWARVEKTETCWLWKGGRYRNGYGFLHIRGRSVQAHRYAVLLSGRTIPPGMIALHTCDVPACVNPDHLIVGTQADNNHDRDAKGRTVIARGEAKPNIKLTRDQVYAIRERQAAGGVTCPRIAADYSVNPSVIYAVVERRTWKHI